MFVQVSLNSFCHFHSFTLLSQSIIFRRARKKISVANNRLITISDNRFELQCYVSFPKRDSKLDLIDINRLL